MLKNATRREWKLNQIRQCADEWKPARRMSWGSSCWVAHNISISINVVVFHETQTAISTFKVKLSLEKKTNAFPFAERNK